ncbi:ATP-binding protein [Pseudomonas costantinii]|uniref:ATP-binding protein n=1 Tax=Pseudomonas costantinii TaxID=168469 RepID=UPI0015A15A41|nr:winged helix-turn-helix domain-containing protein [Pseudomonas costantinii]NVZ70659.1 helix-turn-helix transcriptional regulator [Pseudomonas costantinii]
MEKDARTPKTGCFSVFTGMNNPHAVSFGPYTFHRQQRLVSKSGLPVPLGGRALDILAVLLEAPGQFVSKDTLIARVWPNSVVEENNLRVHIAALRRALDGPRYIRNEPQRGYCCVAPQMLPTAMPRHNLAARLSPVIGRDELLGVLVRRLSAQPLMTLTGCAGVGKSTLALALAERVLPRYRDGVWWVDLSTVEAPVAMLRHLAKAMDLEPCGSAAELCNQLAARQLLLVLDGADLLLGACRHWVRTLRERAPQVAVLLSSREALQVPGEWVQRVPRLALPMPSAWGSVEQAMAYPAVQLFVARVRAGQQGFDLRPQDLAPLRDICRRLDGIPLALELAAAQVDALGIHGLQAQLQRGLQVLTRGRRTAVERHQSLAAALGWSYERLSLPQRWLFLQLGLFKMAVSLPTLSELVAGTELEHADLSYLLARLVGTSLLVVEPGPGPERYRLLNSVRSYALAQLRDPAQVARLQQGYGHYLGPFSGRPFVLQLVEQAACADQIVGSKAFGKSPVDRVQ